MLREVRERVREDLAELSALLPGVRVERPEEGRVVSVVAFLSADSADFDPIANAAMATRAQKR